MTPYRPTEVGNSRLQFTGVLVAGDASDKVGEHLFPLGSCFFIAPFIVLTARHVIDEIYDLFHGCRIHEISGDMKFGVDFAIQNEKHGLMKWSVMGYGYTPTIDATALIVELREPAELPEAFEWNLPTLSFAQAEVGQRISALGYPKSSHRLDADCGAKISLKPHESNGRITEVHERMRDRVMLPHPCFETSARIEGGMSGGPVFSSDGHVIGVIGSSFELGDGAETELSYISAIWPCVGIELRHTAPPIAEAPAPYALQTLVDDGRISAVNLVTSVDQAGTVTILVKV